MISSDSPWVLQPHPRPHAPLRLLCFPYAGGGASFYRTWSSYLPPEIELTPVQLPGHENRLHEQPFTEMSHLIPALASGLGPYLDRPFAFLGYSLGALVSFEFAHYLRRQGKMLPLHLFALSCRAPQKSSPTPPLHTLPDAAFIARLRDFNGTPDALLQSKELMQLMLPVMRADFALYERYKYQSVPALSCSITAYGGRRDPLVARADLQGWATLTDAAFFLRTYPGDHFFIHASLRHVLTDVAARLQRSLGSGFSSSQG